MQTSNRRVLGLGFNVSNAPSSVGTISYTVTVLAPTGIMQSAVYNVTTSGEPDAMRARWNMRWPGALGGSPSCGGCQVVATDMSGGIVSVVPVAAAFSVSAAWKPETPVLTE